MFKGVSKETKVGALTALAITVLVLGYNYMIGKDNPFKGSRDFIVEYDSAQGLIESAPVMYNGFRIGQVRKLRMNEKTHKVVATIEVFDNLNIPEKSHLKIESEILGGVKLKLILGSSKRMAKDKDTLLPDYAKDVMSMVNEKIAPIASGVDSLVSNLNALIGRASVRRTFDELPLLVHTVSETLDNLRQLIEGLRPGVTSSVDNLAVFSKNLDNYGKSINSGLKSFNNFTAKLDSIQLTRMMNSLEATVTSLSKLVEDIKSGKGTLGMLASDEALYNNLVQTTTTLQCLMNDLKENPQKYLPLPWGKRQRKKAMEKSSQQNNCLPPAAPATPARN